MRQKTVLFLIKTLWLLFSASMVFGVLVPSMVSQPNSSVVFLGIALLTFAGIFTVKFGRDLWEEGQEIMKDGL